MKTSLVLADGKEIKITPMEAYNIDLSLEIQVDCIEGGQEDEWAANHQTIVDSIVARHNANPIY